jgi:hypothetical protein
MLTRAVCRLGCALAITAIAAGVSVAPASAKAKTPPTFTAVASWQTGGDAPANVSLQVTRSEGASPVLFFFVSLQFCDAEHDQEVFRSFNGSQPSDDALFAVGPNLGSAVLGARGVPMSGTEQRIDGCTTDAISGAHPTSLASFKASIFGNWMSTAPKTHDAPGITTRDATAFGFEFSHGPLDLGDLGPSQFASLRKSTVPIP